MAWGQQSEVGMRGGARDIDKETGNCNIRALVGYIWDPMGAHGEGHITPSEGVTGKLLRGKLYLN